MARGLIAALALLAAAPATAVAADAPKLIWSVRQLPFHERNLYQSWAPDSRRLAFGEEQGRICIYDVGTGAITPLTGPGAGGQPTWTNDGQIMFSLRPEGAGQGAIANTLRTGPPRLFTMRDDGSGLEEIAVSDEFPRGVNYWDSTTPAKFSPDGKYVSFSIRPGDGWEVAEGTIVRTPEGGLRLQDKRTITGPDEYWNEAKGYTRDGRLIVASSRGDGQGNPNMNPDVYLYDRAAAKLVPYTRNPAWEETLDVVGDAVAFNSDRANLSAGEGQLRPKPPGVDDRRFVLTSVPVIALGMTGHDLYLAGPAGDRGPLLRLTTTADPHEGGWATSQQKISPDGRYIRYQQEQGVQDNGEGRAGRTMLLEFERPPDGAPPRRCRRIPVQVRWGTARIVAVTATVRGRVVARRRGRDVRSIRIAPARAARFTVRLRLTTATGRHRTVTRRLRGCTRT